MIWLTSHSAHRHTAFTLIEVIVVVAMTSIVLATLSGLIAYFYKTNMYTLQQATAVAQARNGVENAMQYLREASYGNDGSYPIASAATSSIVFYADINDNGYAEQVTYRRIGGTFYRTTADATGTPLSYVGAPIATTTVSTSVVNGTSTPIFTYYDSSGNPLSAPVNLSDIASVKTTLVIDVNTGRAPVSLTLSAGATLRNLQGLQ